MKKTLLTFVVLICLLATSAFADSANTWTVCADSCDADSISGAIALASNGDTITVSEGTYAETLNLGNKGLSIIGVGSDSVTIDAEGISGYAIKNLGDGTTLGGFSLINSEHYAIKASSMSDLTIYDVLVQDSAKTGIDLNTVSEATISNVEIIDTVGGFGLMILDSSDVIVSNITTSGNAWAGVSVHAIDADAENIDFEEGFSASEDIPLLLEMDPPYSGEFINVNLPEGFDYAFYGVRNPGDEDYKQWMFKETLEEAEALADVLLASYDYQDVVIYSSELGEYYVSEGLSIQDAIDASSNGDTILIEDGSYSESIVVDKEITLTSNSEDIPVISGDSADSIIEVTADNVLIENIEVNGGEDNSFSYGILVDDSDGVEISNVIVKNVWKNSANGIGVENSEDSDIHDVEISSFHKRGIRYIDSSGEFYNSVVIGDNVNGNDRVQNLVNLWGGSNVEVYDNELYNAITDEESVPTWSSPAIFVSSYGGSGDSYANIYENEIYSSDIGIVLGSTYATTDSSSVDITDNDFYSLNTAISFEKDTASISSMSGNSFTDVETAIDYYDEAPSSVNAENNYWGTAVSSEIEDLVFEEVDFSPYYVDEGMTILSSNEPETVYVVESGSVEGHYFGYDVFNSIQDAIDAVAEDGTVEVSEGTYTENVDISKSLTLIGVKDETVINGDGNEDHVVEITSSDVTIKNFNITNTAVGNYGGVAVIGASRVSVIDNTISESYIGVGAITASDCVVDENLINNNYFGVYLGDESTASSDMNITNNEISNSIYASTPTGHSGDGIYVDKTASNNNYIANNYIHDNGQNGINLRWTTLNVIENNIIENNAAAGIDTTGVTNTIVSNNISGNNIGVSLRINTVSTTLEFNNIYDNENLSLYASSDVTDVVASKNFWGSESPDFSSIIEGDISYDPWCIDSSCESYISESENVSDIVNSGIFDAGKDKENAENITVTDDIGISSGDNTVNLTAGTVIKRSDNKTINASELSIEVKTSSEVGGFGPSYRTDGVLQWGIDGTELTFDPAITLRIYVGTELEGQTLQIFRSTSGTADWTTEGLEQTSCVVEFGFCEFNATKASYYVASTFSPSSGGGSSSGGSGSSSGGSSSSTTTTTSTTESTPDVEDSGDSEVLIEPAEEVTGQSEPVVEETEEQANPLTGQAIADTSALNPKNGGIALIVVAILAIGGFVWYKKRK